MNCMPDSLFSGPFDFAGARKSAYSEYYYFNRSFNPYAQQVRNVCDEWYALYPKQNKNKKMVKDFKSDDDAVHFGAFFELLIYTVLCKLGYEIEIEPKVDIKGKCPDFLANSCSMPSFFVEAAAACGVCTEERKYDNSLNKLANCIQDNLRSSRIFMNARIIKHKMYDQEIKDTITTASNIVCDMINNMSGMRYLYPSPDGNYSVEFINSRNDKMPQRVTFLSGHWVEDPGSIINRLDAKCRQTKHCLLPVIIAINPVGKRAPKSIANILYGDSENGFWYQHKNKTEHVAAVLACFRLSNKVPWEFQSILFLNPWTKSPLESSCKLLDFPKYSNVDGECVFEKGISLVDVLCFHGATNSDNE